MARFPLREIRSSFLDVTSDKLLNCRFTHPHASCTLFCFPWAGGGSNFYSAWGRNMPDNIEVVGLRLPGRESRRSEPCDYSISSLAEHISTTIHTNYKTKRIAFWGHSMGALLAFEVACVMKENFGTEPVHLYVSGVSAPQSPMRKKNKTEVAKMTDKELIQYLHKLGGTPAEILENEEMKKIFLPPLRADYCLLDQFEYVLPENGNPPLTCPISFFYGDRDDQYDKDSWKQLTSGPFLRKQMSGDHFYLKDRSNVDTLHEIIVRDVSELN